MPTSTVTFEGVAFHEAEVSDSALGHVLDIVDGNEKVQSARVASRDVKVVGQGYYVLAYPDAKTRTAEVALLDGLEELARAAGYATLRPQGYFERSGGHYAIMKRVGKMPNKIITVVAEGVFDGVIMDVAAFLANSDIVAVLRSSPGRVAKLRQDGTERHADQSEHTKTVVIDNVEFRDTSLAPAGAAVVLSKMREGGVRFDQLRTVFALKGGTYVVAYESKADRDADAYLHKDVVRLDGRDCDSQIGKFCGEFEFDGHHCLILRSKRERSSLTNSYAFEGIVVHPQKFIELVDSGMFAIIGSAKTKTQKLTEPTA